MVESGIWESRSLDRSPERGRPESARGPSEELGQGGVDSKDGGGTPLTSSRRDLGLILGLGRLGDPRGSGSGSGGIWEYPTADRTLWAMHRAFTPTAYHMYGPLPDPKSRVPPVPGPSTPTKISVEGPWASAARSHVGGRHVLDTGGPVSIPARRGWRAGGARRAPADCAGPPGVYGTKRS